MCLNGKILYICTLIIRVSVMRVFGRIVSFFLLLVSLPLCAAGFWHCLLGSYLHYRQYAWFGVGMLVCFLLGLLLRKNRLMLQTLAHEGAHMIVGLMFMKKINKIQVNASGNGFVEHHGGHNIFITLAPYCFTYLTYLLLLVRTLIMAKYLYIIDILVGFTFLFHLSCFISQTRNHQPDIQSFGVLRSYMFIFTFLFLNFSIIIYSIRVNLWPAFTIFFQDFWNNIVWFYTFLVGLF